MPVAPKVASHSRPEADPAEPPRADAGSPPVRVSTLKRRAEFLETARGRRHVTPGFVLQARARPAPVERPDLVRVGFTCSRKVGNAVARNRAKRRLRALARAVLPARGRPGWDYVLIGRAGTTATRDFAAMCQDLRRALDTVHGAR